MASITQALRQIKADLGQVLSNQHIADVCRACGHKWRSRLLDPVVTVQLFILQVLHGNTAMNHLPRLSGRRFSSAAYCRARMRLPIAVLEKLVRHLAALLQANDGDDAHRWRGHRTFFTDGSACSMPDTPALQEHFGQPSGQRAGCGFPVAHLLALCNAATGMIVELLASPGQPHDLNHVARLHGALRPDDILVADRGFCSYGHLGLLCVQNVHAVLRMHQRTIVDFTPERPHAEGKRTGGRPRSVWLSSLGYRDQLVSWKKPTQPPRMMTRAAYAELPAQLVLRELRYRVRRPGFRTRAVTLVTTLLDPIRYPASALSKLYGARWQIEVNLRNLKQTLGMDVLKSRSVAGVRKELLVFALVYNLVCAVMCDAAAEAGLPVMRISFIDALRALVHASHGHPASAVRVNPARPGRVEPRVLKRRPKSYPLMRQPRAALRKALLKKEVAA
jgi:hypothetical protein